MNCSSKKLAKLLVSHDIVKFGSFTLKSGDASWYYIDLRLIPSYPKLFTYVIDCYIHKLKSLDKEINAVAGIAVAGIPFSSVIGYKTGLSSLIIRKESKEYGRQQMIEGKAPANSNILLIDDVITTGGSKVPAILALREKGFIVKDMLVLIDRSKTKSEELEKLEVNLHSVIKVEDIFDICLTLNEDEIELEKQKIIEKNYEKVA